MKRKHVTRRKGTVPPNPIFRDVESWAEARPVAETSSRKDDNSNDHLPAATNPTFQILRKLFRLVTRDVREAPRGNVFLNLVKDVAYGTLCGIVFILFLSSLDFVFPLRSTSRLRSAAYELLTDPEWMKTIEENIDVRFVDIDIYNAIQAEIRRGEAASGSVYKNEEYQKTVKRLRAQQRELEMVSKEFDNVLSKLGIDVEKFCGSCMASPYVRCGDRLQYVMETYSTSEKKAKVNLMKEGMCHQQPPEGAETKLVEANRQGLGAAKEERDEELSKLEVDLEKWCGGCMVSPWVRCDARVKYIMERYGLSEKQVKENLLKDGMCFLPNS